MCIACLAASWGVSGCGGASRNPLEPEAVAPELKDDRLGRGDVFEVRVYGEEKLSSKYQVSSDGAIDFPLLGTVEAEGLTPGELAQSIQEGLREGGYLREPYVSVFVAETNSRRVSVIGAVSKPGTFPLTPGLSVVQVISLAGGFSSLADRDRTVVTRREDGTIKRYQIPVDAVARGTRDDFLLRPGDIVFVPERIF